MSLKIVLIYNCNSPDSAANTNKTLSSFSPDWQVEVLVRLPLAVHVPVAEPHGDLLGVEALDAVGGRDHVPVVYQGAPTRVLGVTIDGGQEAHVPGILPVLCVAIQVSAVPPSQQGITKPNTALWRAESLEKN